jgi:hypothetical protein
LVVLKATCRVLPVGLCGSSTAWIGRDLASSARTMPAVMRSHAVSASACFEQWGAWGADGVRRDKKRNGRAL